MSDPFQANTKTKEFLRPESLLAAIPLTPGMTIADFGCGNGFYAVAAGTLVGKKGQVFALDILEEALSQTATLAKLQRLHNVSTKQCDLEKLGGSTLLDTTSDLVIISGLLHQVKSKLDILREAYRVLKTAGRVLVVEWYPDVQFGPPPRDRIGKDEVQQLLAQLGFRPVRELPAGAFHYALLYSK